MSSVQSQQAFPFVSVLIPVRNERDFVATCLDSVLASYYPAGRMEILAIDGMSDDGSRRILASYAARLAHVRVIDNPARTTPAALNRGIREARGEIILRLDAHARVAPDYIARCVDWLLSSGADNVGGVMRTLPRERGIVAKAIALALGHRFGVGGSLFRTGAGEPQWTDTVFGGCYRREVFERLGGFNERLTRGQDLELNLRLRHAGGRTLLVPSIRCDYFARSGWWAFLRHNWTNGVWAIRPLFESPVVPVRPRHLAPLGFVLLLGMAAASSWLPPGDVVFAEGTAAVVASPAPASGSWLLIATLSCYLAAAVAAAAAIAWRERDARLALVLPFVFSGLHFPYGAGSVWGLVSGAWMAAVRALGLQGIPNER